MRRVFAMGDLPISGGAKALSDKMIKVSKVITDCFAASSFHIYAPLRSVLNGCPLDIKHPTHNSDSHVASPHFFLIVGRVIKSFIH